MNKKSEKKVQDIEKISEKKEIPVKVELETNKKKEKVQKQKKDVEEEKQTPTPEEIKAAKQKQLSETMFFITKFLMLILIGMSFLLNVLLSEQNARVINDNKILGGYITDVVKENKDLQSKNVEVENQNFELQKELDIAKISVEKIDKIKNIVNGIDEVNGIIIKDLNFENKSGTSTVLPTSNY